MAYARRTHGELKAILHEGRIMAAQQGHAADGAADVLVRRGDEILEAVETDVLGSR